MRDAIKLIEERLDDYIKSHCKVFPDGHFVTTPAQQEYIGELEDIIAMLKRSAEKGGQSPTIDAALNRFEEAALYRHMAGDHYTADDYSEYLESRRGIVSLITTHQEAWASGFSQGTRMARAALGNNPALASLREMSAKMAEDDGLWFGAQTAAEAYLQQELRKLCAVIETA